MKLVVLSDNRTASSEFETEHGLSVYLETDNHKILLDTGASDIFIRNAQRLSIDLSNVDYLFISHGHADHIGGLPYFLAVNQQAKIILSPNIIQARYFSKRTGLHNISINFDFNTLNDRIIYVERNTIIDKHLFIFKNESDAYSQPAGNRNLLVSNSNDVPEPDDFSHELIFVYGAEKPFVYTGCAHQGVLNILKTVGNYHTQSIHYVAGGFHLLDNTEENTYEKPAELHRISACLAEMYPTTGFLTGHCTGDQVYNTLKTTNLLTINRFYAGLTIIL